MPDSHFWPDLIFEVYINFFPLFKTSFASIGVLARIDKKPSNSAGLVFEEQKDTKG
jgi:hypothetical protein